MPGRSVSFCLGLLLPFMALTYLAGGPLWIAGQRQRSARAAHHLGDDHRPLRRVDRAAQSDVLPGFSLARAGYSGPFPRPWPARLKVVPFPREGTPRPFSCSGPSGWLIWFLAGQISFMHHLILMCAPRTGRGRDIDIRGVSGEIVPPRARPSAPVVRDRLHPQDGRATDRCSCSRRTPGKPL